MTERNDRYEVLCEEVRDALSARLNPGAADMEDASVALHLRQCPACTAFQQELVELQELLQTHDEREVDEDRLWSSVDAGISRKSGPDAETISPSAAGVKRRTVLRWGTAAAVAGAFPLGVMFWRGAADQGALFLTEIMEDFRAYRQSGKHLDVETAHSAILRRWMTARVAFALPDDVAGPAGVQLAGGRLCAIRGQKLAFFAYDSTVGPIGLYVTPAVGLGSLEPDRVAATRLDEGLTTITWRRGTLGYVIVSNASIGKLDPFVQHFREITA
ncbi:MAG: zf-HC2 domain-containing protein [Alphaproteobacteria bacterium]|jgi:anti-sigma factor RsiW|nr:zf-HC2 domain-containing protein [Alphaproteobacteria bacterium]